MLKKKKKAKYNLKTVFPSTLPKYWNYMHSLKLKKEKYKEKNRKERKKKERKEKKERETFVFKTVC